MIYLPSSTPTLFMHEPMAPMRTNNKFSYQYRFGGFYAVKQDNAIMGVYRNPENEEASLDVSLSIGNTNMSQSVSLNADQMQALASALLDCVHHLRAVPAKRPR